MCREPEVRVPLVQSDSFSQKTKRKDTNSGTQCNAMPSDPFRVAENEDEQGPEENSDDSSTDEDYNLHIGLIARTWTEKQKERQKSCFEIQMIQIEQ